MKGTTAEAAFVSTNSICQGQQVTPLWKPLFEAGIHINFAHRTFTWANESADQAHVFCVIVGFSYIERGEKFAWNYSKNSVKKESVKRLNGYLADAPSVFLERRSKPLCDVPEVSKGFQPTDNGNLLLSPEQREMLIREEPESARWIRKFSMGAEFIKGEDRYCLWLPEITAVDLKKLPKLRQRIDECRAWRLAQTPTGDAYKLADRPHLLRPTSKFKDGVYIGIPVVSSERRRYIPTGFVKDGMIPGNKLYFIPSDSLYVFGVFNSLFHNAWVRVVSGRLKSDYNYGNTTVYNNFVWPEPTQTQHQTIERCAQAVLDARGVYPDSTLADLYDRDNEFLYPALVKAHQALDKAVEAAYGVNFNGDEQKIATHLFELYRQKAQI